MIFTLRIRPFIYIWNSLPLKDKDKVKLATFETRISGKIRETKTQNSKPQHSVKYRHFS